MTVVPAATEVIGAIETIGATEPRDAIDRRAIAARRPRSRLPRHRQSSRTNPCSDEPLAPCEPRNYGSDIPSSSSASPVAPAPRKNGTG